MNFRSWYEQEDYTSHDTEKPWKSNKDQIIKFWQNLPTSMPIQPINVPDIHHRGSTYMYDGVRVTGSHQFINSVASRLKDIMNYEGGNTKLMLRYHQQVDKNTKQPLPNSYVFYAQVRGNRAQ